MDSPRSQRRPARVLPPLKSTLALLLAAAAAAQSQPPQGSDVDVKFGGEVRERYERFRNAQWGAGPQDDDGYLMNRLMLHGELRAGDGLRAFAELKSAWVTDRTGGPRPTDEDRLDLHQAFVDVTGDGGGVGVTARLGRQELKYGSSRLVSVREGPNVRQSFDGARLLLHSGEWRLDAFAVRPVTTEPGEWDDEPDPARAFFGVYATGPLSLLPDGHVDAYCLVLDRDVAPFQQGIASERRWSLGTRLFGKPAPWDYDCEFVWQTGNWNGGGIVAWTVATDFGFTAPVALTPRFGLKVDVASGDRDPAVDTLQSFYAPFPRGSYFGEPALIGPVNLFDVHPSVDAKLTQELRVFADCDWFWRQSLADGIYSSAGFPTRPGTQSDARFIGSQLQVGCEWQVREDVSLTGVYAHFFAGPYLSDTGAAEDVDYLSIWVTLHF